ncbi:MAG TPA: non-ribosomal peptide synthetase, partial [Anaerolineae bacterium]|nr:non-ribosomal peptide synthetase [Anaerolineae bacterium]
MSSNLNQRIANLSPEKRALLARRLRQKKAAANKMQAITPRADQSSYPLSYAQQRLWFLDQFDPDSPFYNISAALRLTGPLDTAALQKTLQTIGERHEILRVNFQTEKGYPVQVVAPELNVPLPQTDLRDLPPAEREKVAAQLAAAEAQKPFDLSRDPLLRASLLRLDEEEYVFFLTMHHIVSDGWSVGVFIQETAVLYDAFVNGRANPLPPLTIQYSDYADWQRRWLESGVQAEQLAYWQEKLGDTPPILELPTDHPRPAVQSHNGAHHKFAIPPDVAEALRQLGQAEEATLFMTLLAAFHTLLYRYTGQ